MARNIDVLLGQNLHVIPITLQYDRTFGLFRGLEIASCWEYYIFYGKLTDKNVDVMVSEVMRMK